MAPLATGEALVGLLEAYGVEVVFGVPGVHNLELYRALPRSAIRHVLTRHEQGAGFMADGYARATGRPGVCFTITGPGLLNTLTPLGQAWSDSSPVLVVSTALDARDSAQGRGRLHEMLDQRGAAAAVTDLAMRADTPRDIQDAVARAFARWSGGRPRPAYLEIPLDVLAEPAGDGWSARALPSRPAPDEGSIAAAGVRLNAARRPVLIVGGGAADAAAEAVRVAEALRAPVLTTVAGKGIVPEDHPLSRGYRLLHPATVEFLRSADCVLAVGSELAETDFWNTHAVIERNLVRIDIDPASLARPHTAEIAVLADARAALAALAPRLAPRDSSWSPGGGEAATPDAGPAPLAEVLGVVRASLPAETVVVSDMTQIAYAGNELFPVARPRSWIHPVGFGTLGFGLPAAVGARIGVGDRPVAVLTGDYGIQYTINELGTAVEHQLPVIVLLWNNDRLGAIHEGMAQAGIEPNNVTLRNPDFPALARAYGARAERPASLAALTAAIEVALTVPGPTLIEMTPRMIGS